MPYPSKFEQIEQHEQRPMREILIELFPKYGSQRAVARMLDINQSTLYTWLLKLQLVQRTILVPASEAEAEIRYCMKGNNTT